MSFDIISIPSFDKKTKHLVRKYPSLKKELQELKMHLVTNPTSGISLGHNCYKIRIAIASKGTGKSGGARVITHIYVSGSTVYLLTIYDKSEQDNITDKDLLSLINAIR